MRSRCSAARRRRHRSRVVSAITVVLATGLACDAMQSENPRGDRSSDRERSAESSGAGPGSLDALRARADAAFAELDRPSDESPRERFETRVGPQPWPDDLPDGWPRPAGARVVARSTRDGGDRLLMVDLPGPPRQSSADHRDALRRAGFVVEGVPDAGAGEALRVRRGDERARLDFFERDAHTRLEILFVGTPRG